MRDIVDYLSAARQLGGSDLHLVVGAPAAARVNGDLHPLEDDPLTAERAKELIFQGLNETQRARLEQTWELDFAVAVNGVGRFRGNAHYCRGAVEAAYRYIPTDVPAIEDLGHGQAVANLCNVRSGLVLVVGATGMGKTTTLAAMSKRILEQRSCVLVTIEDPIEYSLSHQYGLVKQRQVGDDSKTFAAALRSALRQDPDVIIVSEMRDLDTIATALTAAETGHLVIATLHAIDAPKALDRLIDAFPADQQAQIRAQVAGSLQAIIAQRLLPRADQAGRVLASEVLLANPAVRAIIREGRNERLVGLIQIGASEGMHTIDDSLVHLLLHGFLGFEDATAYARDPEYVKQQVQDHLKQKKR